jgi:hypothetical protein
VSDDHVLVNRVSWDEDAELDDAGREAWAREEPVWGWRNPESQLHLLPDLCGVDAIELGCGTALVKTPSTRYAPTDDGVHIASQVSGVGGVDLVWSEGRLSHVEIL